MVQAIAIASMTESMKAAVAATTSMAMAAAAVIISMVTRAVAATITNKKMPHFKADDIQPDTTIGKRLE